MAPAKTYWTPKRLIDLRVAARTMTPDELVDCFKRPIEDIMRAHRFEANKRRLKLTTRHDIIGGKKIQVTVYGAEYAGDAKDCRSVWMPAPLF